MEKEGTTKGTHNILGNLLVIAVFLVLDILAIAVSISEQSLGFAIVATILGFVGLYALSHDILLFGSMA